jgi:hypothetical protein
VLHQVAEVSTLGIVETESPCERVEHLLGCSDVASLLKADVVVRADACKRRDLFTSQTRHAPLSAVWQTDIDWTKPRTARAQKLA